MKDLTSLLGHASFKEASSILLSSGQPIMATIGSAQKPLGQPLTNQAIHGLLKASLPPDVMALCKWGKSLTHDLDVGGRKFQLQIELTVDKQIRVQAQDAPVKAATVVAAAQMAPVDDLGETRLEAEIEALSGAENGALLYLVNQAPQSQIEDVLTHLGYQPKSTSLAQPVLEVIKFGEFPFMLLCLDENYLQDPVYGHLKHLTMDLRRQMFSVLVAPGLKTGDTMLAFILSVHLVVDTADLADLKEIVGKAKKTWQRQVATFHEFLAAEGKL
jgi:hypothetical protein